MATIVIQYARASAHAQHPRWRLRKAWHCNLTSKMEGRQHLFCNVYPEVASVMASLDEEEEEGAIREDNMEPDDYIDEDEDSLLSALKAMKSEMEEATDIVGPSATCKEAPVPTPPVATSNQLLSWPMEHLDEERKGLGIFSFLPENNEEGNDGHGYGPLTLEYFKDIDSVQPTDFKALRDDQVLCVGVAMMWGWLAASMDCPDCGSVMKLAAKEGKYLDGFVWLCQNLGNVHQLAKRKEIRRCKTEINIR